MNAFSECLRPLQLQSRNNNSTSWINPEGTGPLRGCIPKGLELEEF